MKIEIKWHCSFSIKEFSVIDVFENSRDNVIAKMSFGSTKISITNECIEQQTYQFEQNSVFASSSSIFQAVKVSFQQSRSDFSLYVINYYRVVMLSRTSAYNSNICFWKHYNGSLPNFHFLITLNNALEWKYLSVIFPSACFHNTFTLTRWSMAADTGKCLTTALFPPR